MPPRKSRNSTASAAESDSTRPSQQRLSLLRQPSDASSGTMLRGASFLHEPATVSKKKTAAKRSRHEEAPPENPAFGIDALPNPNPISSDFSAALSALAPSNQPDNGDVEVLSTNSGAFAREPTMLKGDRNRLIGSPAPGKLYTIVLDLDETIVFARDGPLFARAHLKEALRALNQVGELIAWTAGTRDYAKAILRQINIDDIITHLVYRHKSWFDAKDYTKDLRQLGRNMDYVLIIENTPDCLRLNPENGIIVDDFEGGGGKDLTLRNLVQLAADLQVSQLPVPAFLAQYRALRKQKVEQSGREIDIYFLPSTQIRSRAKKSSTSDSGPPTDGGGKVVKKNRDRPTAPSCDGGSGDATHTLAVGTPAQQEVAPQPQRKRRAAKQ